MVGLDLLRSLAIIFVIISHSKVFFTPYYPILNDLSLFGYYGVEMFFVLSGFLIGGILIQNLEKNISIKTFLLKRWFRTMPNYYLFLLLNFLVYTYFFHYPTGGFNYIIFGQNFSSSLELYFFPESWSLTVEEWFYIFISILLYSMTYFFKNLKKSILLLILFIILSNTLFRAYTVYITNLSWDSDVRKVVIFRFDSLLYGVFAAYLYYFYREVWFRYKYLSLSIALFLTLLNIYFFISFYPETINNSYFMKTYYFTITSLSIMFFLPYLTTLCWSNTYPIFTKIVTFISLISYSLYLSHFLLKDIFFKLVHINQIQIAILTWFTWIISSIIISSIIYKYYEKPLTNSRNKFL